MSELTEYTLITGASDGIGKALALRCAKDGQNLLLVSRNKQKLKDLSEEIASEYGVESIYYVADLSEAKAVSGLYNWTKQNEFIVRRLINNAGIGDYALVTNAQTSRLQSIIRLNIEALVVLSQLYAKDMETKRQGSIVNVASIAALVPGPGMAVYYASKSFVMSFSQALAAELEDKNVFVTTVCPGATQSSFATSAAAEKNSVFTGNLPSTKEVAEFIFDAMENKTLVAIWGSKNKIIARLIGLAPRRRVLNRVKRMQNI